ncbi:IMP dehydrogenase [Patescibacteria group bacterium]|nr:IMP dehydrogenase [Patescibacteria group bacterium]
MKNKIVNYEGLTFDDVLLLPNYSEILREDVDLSVSLHPKINLKLPVLSAPMDTVTEEKMVIAMAKSGGLGVIHRNLEIDKQASIVKKTKEEKVDDKETAAIDESGKLLVAAAVGIGPDLQERVKALVKNGVDMLVIDSAHGNSKGVIDAVKIIRGWFSNIALVAGNVATYNGTKALIEAGADVVKVGKGPGSICTTRIITGMGVPQITAVNECVRATESTNVTIIADGGIRQMGDMAKALGFGATAVMLGSLLSGFDESPGDILEHENKKYKVYRGMGSASAMVKGGAERYSQSKDEQKGKLIVEGVEGLTPYKGSVDDYLYQINGSLKSSFFYLGAKNVPTFYKTSRFIKISTAGIIESHPHDVVVTDSGKNYNNK